MKILLAIVHYWDPDGDGNHQSLRPDPKPRVEALQSQLISLKRLGKNQSLLHLEDRAIYRTNDFYRHDIDILLVTDGTHHVIDYLHESFRSCFTEIATKPKGPKFLGFEAQKVLADYLPDNYDLYGYLEDDLVVSDPSFFHKVLWLTKLMGDEFVLLPHRYEYYPYPHLVDRFYIDGPIRETELKSVIPSQSPVRVAQWGGFDVPFCSPLNPHSGCFFLTSNQLKRWSESQIWQNHDVSFVSPLESAATLGIAQSFNILKTPFSHASWFELQHFGCSFHSLIGSSSLSQ